jgi:hypothetical protein
LSISEDSPVNGLIRFFITGLVPIIVAILDDHAFLLGVFFIRLRVTGASIIFGFDLNGIRVARKVLNIRVVIGAFDSGDDVIITADTDFALELLVHRVVGMIAVLGVIVVVVDSLLVVEVGIEVHHTAVLGKRRVLGAFLVVFDDDEVVGVPRVEVLLLGDFDYNVIRDTLLLIEKVMHVVSR